MRGSFIGTAAFLAAISILPSSLSAGEVSLFAAASLKDVLGGLGDAFERARPGVRVVRNFGGSGTLARQVEAGAPCDLFVSAGAEWMDYLAGKGRVAKGSVVPLAFNVLVFAGRESVRARGMKDLPALSRVALGNPASVPAGAYAMQALERSGTAKAMEGRLVRARDVREALLYAERGEADGAFVYRTDALLSRKVKVLFVVPEPLHDRVTYPAALTNGGAANRDAAAFLVFLRSPEARGAFEAAGFPTR